MKKSIIIIVILAIISTITIYFVTKANYHGKISEIKEDNFLLLPIKIDPEADYDVPKIFFNEETRVVGDEIKLKI